MYITSQLRSLFPKMRYVSWLQVQMKYDDRINRGPV